MHQLGFGIDYHAVPARCCAGGFSPHSVCPVPETALRSAARCTWPPAPLHPTLLPAPAPHPCSPPFTPYVHPTLQPTPPQCSPAHHACTPPLLPALHSSLPSNPWSPRSKPSLHSNPLPHSYTPCFTPTDALRQRKRVPHGRPKAQEEQGVLVRAVPGLGRPQKGHRQLPGQGGGQDGMIMTWGARR